MTDDGPDPSGLRLADIHQCFEGAVPAVVATSSAGGTPNVTYLSRVRMVDDHRVALSNQFFSKTARNLAENPRANLLLIDPVTYDEYRLALAYERTERRGPVFERLRTDVDTLAALSGMEDVFRLRAADIYRVVSLERVVGGGAAANPPGTAGADVPPGAVRPGTDRPGTDRVAAVAELAGRLARSADLDQLVGLAVDGLAELLGYEHSLLLLADESGTSLYTVAAHGYPDGGIGSEVEVGMGVIGLAAERGTVVRVGNIRQMDKYSRTVQRRSADAGVEVTGVIALPGLADAGSQVAVPAVAFGQVVGVLFAERDRPVAFSHRDETTLGVVAALVGAAVEAERGRAAAPRGRVARPAALAGRSRIGDAGPLLPRRRQHVPGRRLPDQGRRRTDPLVPPLPVRRGGPGGLHQQGGPARPVPGAPRVPGQPGEPPDPAPAPARRARSPHPPAEGRPGPVPPAGGHHAPPGARGSLTPSPAVGNVPPTEGV